MAKVKALKSGVISYNGYDTITIKEGVEFSMPDDKVEYFASIGHVAPLETATLPPQEAAVIAPAATASETIEGAAVEPPKETKEEGEGEAKGEPDAIELPDFAAMGKKKVAAFAKDNFGLALDSGLSKDEMVQAIEAHIAQIAAAENEGATAE